MVDEYRQMYNPASNQLPLYHDLGAAREHTRDMTPDELMNGGVLQGVQLDPASYIITGLQLGFAQLYVALRLVAMAMR